MVPVECYFVLSALLFFIGVYGFVTRRNLLAMLISVELVLNAVDINFAAINRLLYPNGMEQTVDSCEVDVDSIQDELHGDEHGDEVATGDETEDANEEEQCREHKVTFNRDHVHASFSSFLATTRPPMMHASRNSEMNSKGSTY